MRNAGGAMGEGDDERGTRVDPTVVQQLIDQLAEAHKQIGSLVAIVGAQTPILAGLAPAQKQTTVAQVFAASSKVRQHEHSWADIELKLRPFVKRLGHLRAFEVTPLAWAEHVAARKAEPTIRDKPPADHSLNVELARAKELLDWGVESGIADANLLKRAKPIKTISARETYLTEPQVMELLGGVTDLPSMHAQMVVRAVILCAYDGMMRLEEIRQLRRDRINKDGAVELKAKQTKSRKRRTIGLTPRALAAIDDIPPVLGTHLVFANPNTGKPFGVSTIEAWFRVACIATNIDRYAAEGERVLIHSLRHSGATAADARGASPMAIKEALGHASLATTERYCHRQREASARDMAKLMAEGAEADLAEDADAKRRPPRRSDAQDVAAARPKGKEAGD